MKSDIVIAGGGILGCSVAYWLSGIYDAEISVLEKNERVGLEQSSRNTGNLHRPFYLDPKSRKNFAIAANWGFDIWKKIAYEDGLPWKQVGTLELAVKPNEIETLHKYQHWAQENDMKEEEVQMYNSDEVFNLRPHITAEGALLCKTDTSVNFGALTEAMRKRAKENGVKFLYNSEILDVKIGQHISINLTNGKRIESDRFINTTGNSAVKIAHLCNLGEDYTDLFFRGDYWKVDPKFGKNFPWNVYTVPSHPKYQFLDPHFIVRADGTFDIGPSALLVPTANSYDNPKTFGQTFTPSNLGKYIKKLLERPWKNKIKLFSNGEFRGLAADGIRYTGKDGMIKRRQPFMPTINSKHIIKRGNSGIRSSVINKKGMFEPEAITLHDDHTYHVLAYNSPGASGAPGFGAFIVGEMRDAGFLDGLTAHRKKQVKDIEEIIESFSQAS